MRECLGNMVYELSALLASGANDPFCISIGETCVYYDNEVLLGSSLQAGRLIQLCRERDIHAIRFHSRATGDEILRFLILLADERRQDGFQPEILGEALARAGVFHIDVLLGSEPGALERPDAQPHKSQEAVIQYQALADCLLESHVAAFRGEEIEIEKAFGLVESALAQVHAPAGLLSLASHDRIDSFTVGHSVRVGLLALQVATAGGADRRDLITVGTAALLHDIGKSRIPQEILFKQGPLSREEQQIMSLHPRLGGEVLLEQPQLDRATIGAAFCHHMTPTGGYPTPALPFEPSGVSKLVRVCDVFEALTSVRPYKKALTPLEAYATMFRDEQAFDADWLKFFVRALGIYPQGTFLVLDTGEVALVTEQGTDPTLPRVQLMTGPSGDSLPQNQQTTVQLGKDVDGVVRQVQADGPAPANQENAGPHEDCEHEEPKESIRSCCGLDLLDPKA